MHRKLTVLFVLAVAVLLVGTYEAQSPTATDNSSTAIASGNQAGMILNVDPTTGRIVEQPVSDGHVLSSEADPAFDTSGDGLQQIPSPVHGGGVSMNLSGRFQNAMTATVNADGTLNAPCNTTTTADISATKK